MKTLKNVKCPLDWDPASGIPAVPDSWRRGLAVYAIFLWTKGDGTDITNKEKYSEKRLIGTYKSLKRKYELDEVEVVYDYPSPLTLVRMAKQDEFPYIGNLARHLLSKADLRRVVFDELIEANAEWEREIEGKCNRDGQLYRKPADRFRMYGHGS